MTTFLLILAAAFVGYWAGWATSQWVTKDIRRRTRRLARTLQEDIAIRRSPFSPTFLVAFRLAFSSLLVSMVTVRADTVNLSYNFDVGSFAATCPNGNCGVINITGD